MYYNADMSEQFYNDLLKRSEAGNAQDQRDLACRLWWGGRGFPKDYEASRHWYAEAARQGHKNAQYNYAVMLLDGQGGDANIKEGLKQLKLSVEGHDGEYCAAMELQQIYEEGLFGQAADLKEAQFWENVAEKYRTRDAGFVNSSF